ncbi:MAG: hypothetical protein ACYTFY_20395 [Planctomycetota bacterium]|jgi:N-acetylglucosamine-6-phosphate deacetylase
MSTYKGNLKDGRTVELTVENKKIASIKDIEKDNSLPYVLPVLVDLQHNGSFGIDFHNFLTDDTSGLDKIADFVRAHGVGRIMPTFVSADVDNSIISAGNINKRLSEDADLNTFMESFFHEGIFISPEDGWRGAHPLEQVKKPDYELFKRIDDASGNRFKMVNVAAEEKGGLDFVEAAAKDGKVVALGHAGPNSEIVAEAVARGATMVTHFGNGAKAEIKRFDNPFWAFLHHKELRLGLICDGFHLPKELVSAAIQCKGRENCWIVSDASPYSGCDAGSYDGGSLVPFVITEDRCIHLASGREYLAGNWFQQDRCVEFLVQNLNYDFLEVQNLNYDFLEAWEMCSTVPANMMGINIPEIKEGEEASFALAKYDDGVVIDQSVHLGKEYLKESIRPEAIL